MATFNRLRLLTPQSGEINTGLSRISSITVVLVTSLVVAAFLYYRYSKGKHRRLPYPPGPKPKFMIGNALDIPLTNAGQVYAEWGRNFNSESSTNMAIYLCVYQISSNIDHSTGKIVHAEALGKHIIVVNDLSVAEELFENRAKIYSDRPEVPALKMWVEPWS